jgi:hypothetical protein
MCNRFVQKGREIRPGQSAMVLMRGPGGEFEIPFEDAIFGGPARSESRNYWLRREKAEPVLVPHIERFGEKNQTTGEQTWEDVPPDSAIEGLLLPQPPGKDYRLLKIVTQPATPDQIARCGNDRTPQISNFKSQISNLRSAALPPATAIAARPDPISSPPDR